MEFGVESVPLAQIGSLDSMITCNARPVIGSGVAFWEVLREAIAVSAHGLALGSRPVCRAV